MPESGGYRLSDLGSFTPNGALGPIRLNDGVTQLGRLTTTHEQRQEAVRWILDRLAEKKQGEGRATIVWSRQEPTVLSVVARVENLPADLGVLYVAESVTEQTVTGAEFEESHAQRAEKLREEVSDLAEKGML